MGLFDFKIKKDVKEESGQSILSGSGLVNFIKSKLKTPSDENVLKALKALSTPDDDLEHLTAEGELPWGWHTHTKEFTDKINNEYSYFLNVWIEARNKSPMELYAALKSFVMYLEDLERICKSKGECFEFWFYNILTTEDYLEKRKKELDELVANFDELQANYNKILHYK